MYLPRVDMGWSAIVSNNNVSFPFFLLAYFSCTDPEGAGSPEPPEKSQKYWGFSNTGPGPLKTTKLPSQQLRLCLYH